MIWTRWYRILLLNINGMKTRVLTFVVKIRLGCSELFALLPDFVVFLEKRYNIYTEFFTNKFSPLKDRFQLRWLHSLLPQVCR